MIRLVKAPSREESESGAARLVRVLMWHTVKSSLHSYQRKLSRLRLQGQTNSDLQI